MGITDYARRQICDSFEINLPDEDEEFRAGDVICDIESCRFFDVISPVNGRVLRVNEDLFDNKSLLLDEPYDCWICELSDVAYTQPLLTPTEYAEYITSIEIL